MIKHEAELELNVMHRTYSSLGVYYIDLLVWCYVSLYLITQLCLGVYMLVFCGSGLSVVQQLCSLWGVAFP